MDLSPRPDTPPSPHVFDFAVIDQVVRLVTGRRRMTREDVDDFRQTVHLRLLERGDLIIGRFSGRSSMRSYLVAVVHNLLIDWQNHAYGRWRPSAVAMRHGDAAVSVDRLVTRDAVPVDEAIAQVASHHPHADVAALRTLATQLPRRTRVRTIACDVSACAVPVPFDDPVERGERDRHDARRRRLLAHALVTLRRDQRRLLWLRYRRRMTVPQVARHVGTEPKRLYRHYDAILLALRRRLESA